MKGLWLIAAAALSLPAAALSPEAQEFMRITGELEQLQCEKRRLRRAIALAEAESRDADAARLRSRFAALDRDPKTARLEKRLGDLGERMSDGKGGTFDPEDLPAISRQHREAFYRCD